MQTVTFDTHEFHKGLISSGMPEKEATAVLEGLKKLQFNNVATQEDIQIVKEAIRKVEQKPEKKIEGLKTEIHVLQTAVENIELTMVTQKDLLEVSGNLKDLINERHISTTRWMLGLFVALSAMMVGLKIFG